MISDLVNYLLSSDGSTFIKMVELVQPGYSTYLFYIKLWNNSSMKPFSGFDFSLKLVTV